MMVEELLEQDDLAKAMTRPTMIGGFSLTSLCFSFYVPVMTATLTKQMILLLTVPVFLLVSWAICLKDVFLFEIAIAMMHKMKSCNNKRHWGCRSYAPY